MKRKINLRLLLYIDIAIVLILIFYKSYLFIFETDYQSLNINNINKMKSIQKYDNEISFAVLGNINNSMDIFDKKIVNEINNDKDIDFAISTGNAVIDGSEDKYRMLNKSLRKMRIPTIMGIGENEISDEGALRFYKHFGPFYYSFNVDNAYFIFLDTTGKTTEDWQREWLVKELKNAAKYKYRFVFMNKPVFQIENDYVLNKDKQIENGQYGEFLTKTFAEYKVTAVFASNLEVFNKKNIDGIPYYISGGSGGSLIINDKNSFYHYIKVNAKPDGVEYNIMRQEKTSSFVVYQVLENIWFYIHSLFYINFTNFILILSILVYIGIIIYIKASKEVDYYRDFDEISKDTSKKRALNIAMFTNNYLPFIGGVPISIERLAKGLMENGHNVYIFAPKYPQEYSNEPENVIRCKLLTYYHTKQFSFPIVNIFSKEIENIFSSYDFDVIHVHHPFWMGSKGLSLGKKYGIPVVLTYHTRLEKYAHYLPFMKLIFKNIISHYMIRKFSQKCDAVFAPTNTAKEYLANIGVSRHIAVLPTGINFDCYESAAEKNIQIIKKRYTNQNEVLLCSVSRLSKEKNIYFLLEGIKYIKEHSNVSFKCNIIGDGPEKDNIIKKIEEEDLKDTVNLVGSIAPEKVCEYYMASDIFVFSSQSETQGMVLLEAMAGGCPIIAIRSSGIDDVINNGYNGFKTKADIGLWSEKVIYLMENSDKLKDMTKNAYDFSKRFSAEAMAERAAKVYYKAIKLQESHLK